MRILVIRSLYIQAFICVYNEYTYKWHVCLGSYILEQEEGRDIRKNGRVGEQGREEIQ